MLRKVDFVETPVIECLPCDAVRCECGELVWFWRPGPNGGLFCIPCWILFCSFKIEDGELTPFVQMRYWLMEKCL